MHNLRGKFFIERFFYRTNTFTLLYNSVPLYGHINSLRYRAIHSGTYRHIYQHYYTALYTGTYTGIVHRHTTPAQAQHTGTHARRQARQRDSEARQRTHTWGKARTHAVTDHKSTQMIEPITQRSNKALKPITTNNQKYNHKPHQSRPRSHTYQSQSITWKRSRNKARGTTGDRVPVHRPTGVLKIYNNFLKPFVVKYGKGTYYMILSISMLTCKKILPRVFKTFSANLLQCCVI